MEKTNILQLKSRVKQINNGMMYLNDLLYQYNKNLAKSLVQKMGTENIWYRKIKGISLLLLVYEIRRKDIEMKIRELE